MEETMQVSSTAMIKSLLISCLFLGSLVAEEPPVAIKDSKWLTANWPGKNSKDHDQVSVKESLDFAVPNRRRQDVSVEEIPVDVLQRVASVEDASEFINKFLMYPKKYQDTLGGELTGKSEEGVAKVISRSSTSFRRPPGIGKNFARQALCTPSPQVIELKKKADPLVLYFPTCTRVNRCGGCCRSSLLECQPSQISNKNLQVIRAKYSSFRSRPFDYEAIENITVEEHTKCKCQCKIKESDCHFLQTYKLNECKCECNNQAEAKDCKGSDKFWDSNSCGCKCKNFRDQCSTGLKFSENVCRCIPEAVYNIQGGGDSDFLLGRSGGPLRRISKA